MRIGARTKVTLAVLFTTGAVALGVRVLVLCCASQPVAPTPRRSEPLARLKGASIILRSDGSRVWDLKAETIEVARDRRTTSLSGITNGTLYRDGKPLMALSAPRAVFDNSSRSLTITGGVTVTGPKGMKLITHSIAWVPSAKRLVCPGPVTVRTPNGILMGDRLEADLDLQQCTIYGIRLRADTRKLPGRGGPA